MWEATSWRRVLRKPGPRGCANRLPERWRMCASRPRAAYYRTVDPTPLVGVRPGAVAAAVAGCLAVGGGATYCVQQSTDPITVFTGLAGTAHHEHKPKPHTRRARAAQAPTTPAVTPTVTAAPTPTPTPTSTVQTTTAQAPATTATTSAPPPAPEDQFEPTSPGTTSQPPAQTSTSKPKQPAPAPAGGPGEFDGP